MTRYSPQWKEDLSPMPYNTRDIEYFQGMYPQRIKELQAYVIKQCDTMDYAGSPIYDEYPDPLMLDRACTAICQSLPQTLQADAAVILSDKDWTEGEEVEIYEAVPSQIEAMNWGPPSGNRPPSGPPPWGPPPGNRPPGGPPPWGPPPGNRPPGGPPPWGPPPGNRPPGGPPPWGPPPGNRPPGGPPPWGPPPGNPPSGGGLVSDIVKVLLMNELQRRRCRTGRCW